jgi:multicomponent Na+:H+ antiporter subunit D
VKEAPPNMLIAMGIAAAMCIGIGVFPGLLYALLPNQPETYVPYTVPHVVSQLQLLLWAALAFSVLNWYRIYPPELRSTNLDFDWVYRRAGPAVVNVCGRLITSVQNAVVTVAQDSLVWAIGRVHRHHGPQGLLARTSPTGSMALWVAILLGAVLVLYFT